MEIPVQSGQGYGHIYLNIVLLPGLGPQQPYGNAGDEQAVREECLKPTFR